MTSLRSRLFHGTAVAAALVLVPSASPAATIALPTGGTVQAGTVTATGTGTVQAGGTFVAGGPPAIGAVTPGMGDTLTLTVGSGNHNSAVINWSGGFDIGSSNTVTFVGPSTTTPFSVLNRVTSGSITTIAGILQGDMNASAGSRGTVFVSNESGITFANSATVTNLTGLVASSLDITVADFNLFAAGTQPLHFAGTGSNAVSVDPDAGMTHATIAPDSVLLLVAPQLSVNGGQLSAADTGFVLANDAKVALSATSIISMEIDKGTAITSSVLNGTIAGQRVLVAAASSTDLTASLLGVGGNLTAMTATATDHGIVIAVGRDAPIDATNSITFANVNQPNPGDPGARFTAGVDLSGGTLNSSGRIDVVAGDLVKVGAATATGAATFTAGAALTFAGDVSAGGLMGSGTSLTLGVDGAAHSLTATGTGAPITLTASVGGAAAITTLGNFTIGAPGAVVLQQSAGVAANVTHDDSLAITGSSVSVGDIALAAMPPALVGSGDVVLTANGALTTDAVTAGVVTARNAVAVSSANGSVTLGGATSGTAGATAHDVTVTAATNADVTGAVTSAGDYTVLAHGITLGSAAAGIAQSAVGNLYIRSGSNIFASGTLVADSGGVGGKRLVLDASSGALFNSAFGPVNLRAGPIGTPTSAILLSLGSGSDLALGTVSANSFGTATPAATPTSVSDYTPDGTLILAGAITLGTVTTVQPVTIASTGTMAGHEDVNAGAVSSGGAIAVSSANGAVTLAGATSGGTGDVTVSAAGIATVSGAVTSAGDYTVSGSSVSLGGAGINQAAVGDVLIKSTSTNIAVAGSLTADSGGAGSHVLVLDSSAAISGGGNLSAGTQSDVLLAVNGDVTLGSVNARQFASTATHALPLAAGNYGPTAADTLSTTGAITLGAVTTAQANTIASTGATSGHQDVLLTSDTSSSGGVTLSSANNVTVGQLISGGTSDIMVTATGGVATVNASVSSTRDYVVNGGSVVLGEHGFGTPQQAARNISITSTIGGITAGDALALISNSTSASAAGAGTLTLSAATNIGDPANPEFINLYAGQVAGDIYGGAVNSNAASRRAITLDVIASPTGSISLANVSGASLTGPAAAPLAAGGPIALGDVNVLSDLNVTSSAALSLTSGVATGNIALSGTTVTLGAAGTTNSLTTTTGAKTATLTASVGGAAAITTLGNFTIGAPGAVVLQQSAGVAANVTHDDSLAITGSSVSVGDIALAAMPPALVGSGDVVLTANGALTTDAVTAGVVTARNAVAVSSANGSVTLGGATSGTAGATAHDVTVTAATNADVTGAVTSAGDYTVLAHGITLGSAAAGIAQSAVGNLYIRSGSNIFASGTLVADSGGVGGKRLVLDASSGALFNSAFGPVNLRAGPIGTPTSAILLSLGSGSDLALGTVSANSFGTATPAATPTSVSDYTPLLTGGVGTLQTNGAITAAVVTTVQSNSIVSDGTVAGQRDVMLAGDTSTTGSVEVGSGSGAVSITGAVSAGTSVHLHADGSTLSVATVEAFGGAATFAGHTGITVVSGNAVAASTHVGLSSDGAITTNDVRAGGGGIGVGGYSGAAAASLTGGSLQANGAITVSTTGAIDLTGGTIVATERKLLNTTTLATFDGAATAPDADVSLTGGGAIHVAALASTGSITLNGSGAVTVPGTVAAGDGTTAAGSGNYTLIGGNVVAGGAGIAQTATGDVLVRSTATNIAAAGTLTAGGGLVLDSATSIDGITSPGPVLAVANLVATNDVLLRKGVGSAITLGDIGAARLASANGGANPLVVGDYTPVLTAGVVGTLISSGSITLGAVTTAQSNAILATGATLGQRNVTLASDTSTTGSVEVGSSAGAVSITGLVSAHTSADLHADGAVDPMDATAGTLAVTTVEAFNGDATLIGGTGITVAAGNPVAALDNVNLLSGGAIATDAVRAGGVITVAGVTPGTGAASLTTTGLTANGGISVTTVGALDLSALGLLTPRPSINADLSGFNTGNTPYVGTASIALTSTASSVKAAAITATGSITLNAATTATVTGNVEAGFSGGSGDYIVTGSEVALGGTGTTQKASGDVWIRSTGDLNLTGTLIADDGGTGGLRLVLDTAGAIAPIGGLPAATLVAGAATPAHRSDVLIRQGDDTQPITLGDVTANQFASATTTATPPLSVADYAVPAANTLTSAGVITLGAVNTLQSNMIASVGPSATGNIVVGSDTSAGAVVLTSTNGSVTANGPILAATSVGLNATGPLTVGDVTAQNGDATLTGGTIGATAGTHAIAAQGAVYLQSPGAITLAADAISGDAITIGGSAGAGSAAASLVADSLHASGPITVLSTGDIMLLGANATSLITSRATPAAADADATLTSSAGAVSIKNATTTGNLTLDASGTANATGTVTVGDASTLAVSGNYSVAGSTIALGGPGVVQSATGTIALTSPGAITVSTLLARGSIFAVGPGGATPFAGSLSGITLQANGVIDVAASGAITLTGTGSARTATERTAFDPTLRTFTLTGAPLASDQSVTLASSTGAVTAADLASTRNIALSAGGVVTVSGVVAAGDGMTVAGDGNYSALGSRIALGGGVPGQAALGNISLQTPGAITLTALRAGGTITAAGVPVGATPTSAASLIGDSLQANGAITVATTGAITLQGVHAVSVATERQRIDGNLGGFNGAATASDANISLTATGTNAPSVSGTISVNGGSSTGNIMLTAGTTGTPVASGAIIATGTFFAGDTATASGSGDFTANAYDVADASAATINARHSISVISQTNDALIGTATAGLNTVVGGAITAQTLASGLVHGTTGAVASIQSGTTALGDLSALATGAQGVATIASGTVTQGNVLADGNAAATVTLATTLGASGDITAHSQSGTATVTSGTARGSVSALAGGAALVGTGIAANGNVNALGGTTATITSGTASSTTAALGNVRATSTGGGLATITGGSAAQSVVASGGSVVVGNATAGDDIVMIASTGAATATMLTVTGAAATETAATDASGAALTFGGSPVTGLGGSNVIIRAAGAATVTGAVSVLQADITKSANYDILAGSVTLGTSGVPLVQGAAGRVDITANSGDVVLTGTSGLLTSNAGGNRVANTVASAAVAGGSLTIVAAGNVTGASTGLVATARLLPSGYDVRENQPGVTVTSTSGSIELATITGGPATVTAPVVVDVPVVTSWGDVLLAGSPSFADTATIIPVQIIVDGRNAGAVNPALAYAPANITVAGGAGAEVTSLTVANGGLVGALQVLSNSGAATLRATPNDPTKIASILVESQTGVAGILNPAGGPASSTNPNTVAAQTIVLRGRQVGSSVLATGPLLATGSILATGPSVTIGTAAVAGTSADGTGDILIAATNTASLAAGATETAVARRTINVTGGAATLGDGTATGGTLAVSGNSVTVLRNAVAGDDVVLSSLGAITATNAVIRTNGSADLQSGDDTVGLSVVSVGATPGTGYGAGHTVGTNVLTTDLDVTTGRSLTQLAGANIVATAGGNIDLSAATLTATAGRDIHVEAIGTVTLATASAARQFIGASGGNFTATGSIAAGDDLVIVTSGALDVSAATLSTTDGAASATDARRADGTLLALPVTGDAVTNLAGSNIALAAVGPIQLGAIATTAAPSSLRVFSGAGITTTQAISVSGDIALVGTTVTAPYALTAGDDIVAVAQGGAATLVGALTTTGTAASNAALVDLAGNGIALPGEGVLGRVDGSSILVAATGTATVSTTVASAGRYSVYGRGGITLGTAGVGTSQSAAGDILLEASIGAAPAPASVTLANGMILTANSDGIEAERPGGFVADPLVIRVGNGSVAAGGATLRVLRTPNATLADQGTVQIQPVVADGVTSIAVQTLDSASADLRALGDVTIGSASVDAGLTLASKAGAVTLTTLTVGTAVPLMTAAQVDAIDVNLSGATGAALGTVTTGANLVRDITVATVGGDATITTASARDDIVIASTTGRAIAGDLTFAGTASDSEAGVATVAATDANGVALPDPYGLTGTTITGLAGRNIVVSGATAASLNSVTTAASDSLGDVRVLTAAGPATLTTVTTGGAGLPGRIIVATRNGVATGTSLNASGDIIVDATAGSAVLTSGNAGRDGIVVAPTVSIGTLSAGDDIVAVATGGSLTAGTLTSTGANTGDGITTVFRADGTSIVDPVAGGIVGNLAGGNVVALASGDITVGSATATAASGATVPGLVRLASLGTTTVTAATATAGDIVLTGATIDARTALSAGRDATITTNGAATLPQLTAGRDVMIAAASASLGADTGLVAAQRNLVVTTTGALTIGTARAGEDLTATGGSVLATTLGAGDALTVTATNGDATVTTATSTGLPLLADFSGFAATGAAPGTTRDINVSATGVATIGAATAVDTVTLSGSSTVLTTGAANFIDVTAGSGGAVVTTATAGQDFTVNAIGPTTVQHASAGRDASVTVTGSGATTVDLLMAGRDLTVDAGGSASLGTDTGLIAAQRNIALTAASLTVGTARAGGTLSVTGATVSATMLASGDALTVNATNGDATLASASSTGLPLLADFSGFATSGTALGAKRDVTVSATGAATVTTATAVHSISISGDSVAVTTATANIGGTDGDLAVAADQGNAVLTTGSARDVRVTASGGGSAQAGTVAATRDLFVDARALNAGTPGGTASLGTGTAGRDAVVVGPTVMIGSVTAAANVVAVADAGTLTATTLTSTGSVSGDGLATIARADGTPVLDPTVPGSPPIGSLAGGNVVALASGDLTVGTVTATAAPGAAALGLVRLASLGNTTVTTATASAGDIVAAGVTVTGGTLSAGRDTTVTAAGGDVNLGTVGTGRGLVLTASNDVVVTGTATASGQATLTAGRDINLAATATGDALDAGGNATLVSGRDIIVARPITVGLALTVTAAGAGSFAGTTSGGATTIGTQGDLTLAADTNATGALALSSAGGAITAPDISGNGITLTAATAGTVTGTTTSPAGLSATGASLNFGVIVAASDATLHATGALAVSGMTTTGGALTATSDTASIQMGAVTTGGPATITAGDANNGLITLASLGTTGAATLLAGQSATVTGLAQASGALTATATNGGLSFGAINSGATATLRARSALSVAGLATTAATLDALSSAGAISLGSAQAATIVLRGATGVTVSGGTTATGPVTITADAGPVATGDIAAGAATSVTATNGAITVASISRTAGLTVTASTDATVTGDINASGDVGVTATAGSATIGSVSNAGKLTVTAANNATINGQVNTSADAAVTATNGSATVGGAVKTANYTIKADNGTITLGSPATATQASSGTVTLDSQRLTLGAGLALVATKQIELDVTGNAAGVSLGDGVGAAAGATKYALSNADLRKLQSPVLEIAAAALPVNIGLVDLDSVAPVAGGFAGITGAFGIRTTGNIVLADTLTFTSVATTATPRVLTLGGAAGGADLDQTTPTANAIEVLAAPGLDNSSIATSVGGQINATGSTVQLRATYIALGESLAETPPLVGRPFVDALLPANGTPATTAEARSLYANNAGSTLYLATPPYTKQAPPQAIVQAGTLVVAPGQWALIQNTGQTTTPGGGIIATTVKFNKVAGAAAADPEIALFGSIAGKTGIASAISVDAGNLDGISPNNIRINGCVALSTAGCIQSAVSIPLINLADPGQSLLISNSPDLALSIELITGATNEALWREDEDDATPGQERPQRESRP